ncbi:VWA domain-containing protein [candidate division KSB1 bacterium]|nr:VWA domain-containing protein [candidate division KSB1 bacterium]
MSIALLNKIHKPLIVFIFLIVFIPLSIQAQFSYSQKAMADNVNICINNISINNEIELYGLSGHFPYPVISTISVLDSFHKKIVIGLADTSRWLGPDDVAENGELIKQIWQSVLEYHEQDPMVPEDPDTYQQIPQPLFTEIRESMNYPTSTMLVMDASYSMANEISDAREAVLSFVEGMRPVDSAGVIVFDHEIKAYQPMTDDMDAIRQIVENAESKGKTALYDALMLAIEGTKFANGRRAIVVYADGEDNSSSPENTEESVIDSARAYNLPVYTIALSDSANTETLKYIAQMTGGLFLKKTNHVSIKDIYDQLYKVIQNFYVMAHATPDPEYNRTWRAVDLKAYFGNQYSGGRGFYFVGGPPDDLSTDLTLNLASRTDTTVIIDADTLNAIYPGDNYEYQLKIRNIGKYYAKDVTLVLHLPDSVSFRDASIQPTESAGDSIVWEFPIFQVGRNEEIVVSVQLASEVPKELVTLPSEAILHTIDNALYERDVATDTVRIIRRSVPELPKNYDLSLSQSAQTDTALDIDGQAIPAVLLGDSLQYRLNIKNNGPVTAHDFEVQNQMPDSVSTFNINLPVSKQMGDTLFWQFDSLAAGDSILITFQARVSDSLQLTPFPLVNTCRIIAPNDTLLENNLSWLTVYAIERVIEEPKFTDVELSLISETDTFRVIDEDTVAAVEPGDQFNYELSIRNLGSVRSDSLSILFKLPDSVSFLNASLLPPSTIDTLEWELAGLDPQNNQNIIVTVRLDKDIPGDLNELIGNARINLENDSLLTNNIAADTIRILHFTPKPVGQYDLAISQFAETDTVIQVMGSDVQAVLQGNRFLWHLNIKNFGPDIARNFAVVDYLPDSVTFFAASITPEVQNEDSLFWKFDSLAAGDSVRISFELTAADTFPSSPFILINACRLIAESDTVTGNNRSENAVFGINRTTSPEVFTDISIRQSVSTNMMIELAGETVPAVFMGNSFFYKIIVENEGDETARNLELLDYIPDSVNVSNFSRSPLLENADSLFWRFDSLTSGDSIVIAFETQVFGDLPFAPFPLLNICEVFVDNDSSSANNRYITTVYAIEYSNNEKGLTDLDLAAKVRADSFIVINADTIFVLKPGDSYNYDLSIRNVGQYAADSIQLSFILPDSVKLIDVLPEAQIMTTDSLRWNIDAIVPQQVMNFAMRLQLSSKSPLSLAKLINSASLFSTDDSSDGNNIVLDTMLVSHRILPEPHESYDLVVTQNVITDTIIEINGEMVSAVLENDNYRYDLKIANNGPATAYDISLRNLIPDFVSISEINPTVVEQNGDTLFWQIDSLNFGDSTQFSFQSQVIDSLPSTPFPLINRCEIFSENDTTAGNNISESTVYAIARPVPPPPVVWEPYIEAHPATANIGDEIRVYARTSISIDRWDIRIYFADGSVDSTFADGFIRSTILEAGILTEVDPVFTIDRMRTEEVKEQITFELQATDSTGITKTVSTVVNVLDDGTLNFDKNVFRPDQDNNLEINFKLITDSKVRLEIYDVAGTRISTLAEAQFSSGWNTYNWYGHLENGKKIGSGVYIITMRSKLQNAWKKLLIVR